MNGVGKDEEKPPLKSEQKCHEGSEQDMPVNDEKLSSFKLPSVNKDSKSNESKDLEKEKVPELRYKVPWWSATPPQTHDFNLEVLKNGCIVSTIDLNDKEYHVFGRLPLCDVVLEHPSISRYHAVIQYRGETEGDKTLSGLYLYDLGSTHGTLVNKSKIKSKTYYRLKIGYVIKFGGSSRLFVLQGPASDQEEESETLASATATEGSTKIKAGQIFTDEEYESLKKVDKKEGKSEGIDWGFGEDAEEEHIDSERFDELYSGVEFRDPKKTLRGYYEREGLDLEYQVDETGPGHARVYHCRIRLPVDGPNGSAVYAEASVTGKKKEAVKECANEACKMLDAYGLLRQSNHESRKKRQRNLEDDDFYESDEDNFLDRTGAVETKRLKRMQKAGKAKQEVETYDSLSEKLHKVQEEIKSIEKQITDATAFDTSNDEDSLDSYMKTMSQRIDKGTKLKLKRKIIELKKEEERIAKLTDVAKPTQFSSLQNLSNADQSSMKIGGKELNEKNSAFTEKPDSPRKEITENKAGGGNTSARENSGECIAKAGNQKSVQQAETKPSTAKESTGFAVPTRPGMRPVKSKKNLRSTDHGKDTDENVPEDKLQAEKEARNTKTTGKEAVETKLRVNETGQEETPKDSLQVAKKKKRYTAPTQWEDANDPDFANWMPPQDQSGDGRTKLNDKYGY